MRIELKEKEENCEILEVEIFSLIKELEKTIENLNRSLMFRNIFEILENILNFQVSPLIKKSIGYNKKQNNLKGDASTKVTKPLEKCNK